MLIWNAYTRMVDALAFSPDGQTLALAGYHLACRLIDTTTGQRQWTAESMQTFGLSIAFAPKESLLCKSGSLSLVRARDGAPIRKCGNWCRAFGVAPDGRTAFVADGGFQDLVRRYDLRTGKSRSEVELEAGAINRIAVSPDGELVAVLGCKRFTLLTARKLEVIASESQRGLSTGAFALAFSPCGRNVIYTAGRTLFVWDVAAARAVNQISLDSKHFMDAAFTPDGRRLITVSKEGMARVWDTTTWACERCLAWDVGPLRAVAVSPDGTCAAVAGNSGRVVVWDLDA